ncbi:MAG TPA: ABC transporter ATP-binding protein [Methylomirabilota bacterium]|nr:ABC transporter ATP-binding protein [Methylomirabilota bacterium]
MARIELTNVCATLQSRERAVPVPDLVSRPDRRARGSVFSIRDLNLTVFDGETLVILGPSGCGKTTLLKIIAGLIAPDSGDVRYDGMAMNNVPPGDRRIGMVFQNYALYPHMTSRTNVLSYFLFRKKTPALDTMAREKYQRTSELLGVELESLLDRRPTTLSGGEKQRVALGRCITRDPAVFLLDEPFSSLDQALRERYRVNLKILLQQFGISTVYVTHDHVEALILADRLAIMDRGSIEQVGSYQEIYQRPRNVFVAGFLNRHVGTPPISLIDARHLPPARHAGNAQVGIRPEDVEVSRDERPAGVVGVVAGKLSLPMLSATILTVRVDEHEVYAQMPGEQSVMPGDRVWLTFRKYHLFDKQSGARLRSYPEPDAAA